MWLWSLMSNATLTAGEMDTLHMLTHMTQGHKTKTIKGEDFTSCGGTEQQIVNGGGSKAEVKWRWHLGNRLNNSGKGCFTTSVAKDRSNHWWLREAKARFPFKRFKRIGSGWNRQRFLVFLFKNVLCLPISLSHHCYLTSRAMGTARGGPSKPKLSRETSSTILTTIHTFKEKFMQSINRETLNKGTHQTHLGKICFGDLGTFSSFFYIFSSVVKIILTPSVANNRPSAGVPNLPVF